MLCQQSLESELLWTELALIRFFPSVHPFVLLQFLKLLEAFLTVAATVWSLFRVTEHVYFEVSPPGTGLATLLAFKQFFPCMDQLVILQSAFAPKLLLAHLAAVRFLSRVGEEVLLEGVQQIESFSALLAGMTFLSWSLVRYILTFVVFPVLFVDAHMQS